MLFSKCYSPYCWTSPPVSPSNDALHLQTLLHLLDLRAPLNTVDSGPHRICLLFQHDLVSLKLLWSFFQNHFLPAEIPGTAAFSRWYHLWPKRELEQDYDLLVSMWTFITGMIADVLVLGIKIICVWTDHPKTLFKGDKRFPELIFWGKMPPPCPLPLC